MAPAPFWITKSVFSGPAQPDQALARSTALTTRRPPPAHESNMTEDGFETEALAAEQMDEVVEAWSALAARSAEPNGFFEPGFALSAARHFPAKSRPVFILVWKREADDAANRRLVALFPIVAPSPSFGAGVARGWLHKQAALATPLIDEAYADQAATALCGWFAQNLPGAGAILFPKIPVAGPVFSALTRAARQTGRQWRVLDQHDRATLLPGGDPEELWTRQTSRKALKELHRRQRRLEDLGPVRYLTFSTPDDIRRATEDFLMLEAGGWKAKRGALLGQPSLTTFVRSATRLLAHDDKCRIHSLELAGRPIAIGIVIESAGRAYFWKIAYDESLRSQAPGVQLVYAITRARTARDDLDMTNSCAIAGHPMIDRVWPDRLAVGDLMIQSRPGGEADFAQACGKETFRRRIRALAKKTANRLLNRKES